MTTDAQKRIWEQQMHQEYCSWIESINAGNRARAHLNGGLALITDPETGRQKMEGLHPGQMVWFDGKDGPRSQQGRRHFYGPDWQGPFPEYGIVATLSRGRPPNALECLRAVFDFVTAAQDTDARRAPQRTDAGLIRRIGAALHNKLHR
jgi:hypothetical protein